MERSGIALVLILLVLVLLAVKRVRDPERILVLRLGKVNRIAGPGVVWLIPGVDRGLRLDMDEVVPEWRSLQPPELLARLVEHVSQPRQPAP